MHSALSKEKLLEARRSEAQALKITTQYRDKRGMVYELAEGTHAVHLYVFQEQSSWHVEVREGHHSQTVLVTRVAETRAEALSEVGKWWTSSAIDMQLPRFDWQAIAVLLKSVRAL